jgi:hypothetical protein
MEVFLFVLQAKGTFQLLQLAAILQFQIKYAEVLSYDIVITKGVCFM